MYYHIFLSYSHKDSAIMQRIRADLHRANLQVWTDEGIEPGTPSWQKAIEVAILGSCTLVCILSPDAAKSEWVREELNFARTHGKPVLLMMARGDERVSVPFGYSTSQWVDIRQRESYAENVKRLIVSIQKRFKDVPMEDPPEMILPPQPAHLGRMQTERLNTAETLATATGQLSILLPEPFKWCAIPAGHVEIDNTRHVVPEFQMAKYPVTNLQFQTFVNAEDGYRNDVWWSFSTAAQEWRKLYPRPEDREFFGDEIPRTNVSWYEAMAFCRWMNASLKTPGFMITLPTEQQWQWAAEGEDRRVYPWGNEYDKTRANTLKTGNEQPTPVTQYISGISVFGVMDMCGNVSEWCLNNHATLMVQIDSDRNKSLRGSAWDASRSFARSVTRDYAEPGMRSVSIGFRICCVQIESI